MTDGLAILAERMKSLDRSRPAPIIPTMPAAPAPAPSPVKEFYTRTELAELLGISVKTLDTLAIPRMQITSRTIRYRRSTVEAFMAKKKSGGANRTTSRRKLMQQPLYNQPSGEFKPEFDRARRRASRIQGQHDRRCSVNSRALGELAHMAQRATQKPWHAMRMVDGSYAVAAGGSLVSHPDVDGVSTAPLARILHNRFVAQGVAQSLAEHDAAFIAATSPAVVLALVREVRRLRKKLKALRGGM